MMLRGSAIGLNVEPFLRQLQQSGHPVVPGVGCERAPTPAGDDRIKITRSGEHPVQCAQHLIDGVEGDAFLRGGIV